MNTRSSLLFVLVLAAIGIAGCTFQLRVQLEVDQPVFPVASMGAPAVLPPGSGVPAPSN